MSVKNLGAKIKTLRGKRTIREMANLCKISPATICRIEQGKYPDIESFIKICLAFNADANDLLGLIK